MSINIQHASRLGELYKELGLNADSRVAITSFNGSDRIEIWDLNSGRYFVALPFASPPSIEETHLEIPEWLKRIFNTPSDALLAEYRATWEDGADDRRMTIFAELTYRGVKVL